MGEGVNKHQIYVLIKLRLQYCLLVAISGGRNGLSYFEKGAQDLSSCQVSLAATK